MSYLLTERLNWDQAQILVEGGGADKDTGKPKDLYMKGLFIQGGVKNHNQRVYPVNEIRTAVESINEIIRKGETIWGEADHPEGLQINLDRVSHMITEMWQDGPNGYGKLRIVPTPMGNIVRTLIECGGKLGVSSRGSGNVNESNGEVSDFEIITVDIVARPSAPNAYPNAVYERKLYDIYNSKYGSRVEDLAANVNTDPKAQKYLKEEVLRWMDKALKA
jgi:hypothetical protein